MGNTFGGFFQSYSSLSPSQWTLVTLNTIAYGLFDNDDILYNVFSALYLDNTFNGLTAMIYQVPFEESDIWTFGGFLGQIANLRIYSPGAAYLDSPGFLSP